MLHLECCYRLLLQFKISNFAESVTFLNMRSIDFEKVLLKVFLAVMIMIASGKSIAAPQLPEPELSWKNVAVDGKKTSVFCIFKDTRGIMWLGTNSGLYFYDGVTTHPVGDSQLAGTQIYSILEKDDRLYIGSNNGLLVYDYASGIVNESGIDTPREIRALLLVDDCIWIGGLNGIYRLNINENAIRDCSNGLPHKSVYSILRDSRGILYVGTYNGVARWDSNAEIFRPLKIRNCNSAENTRLFANCLLESSDNESIFIGGEGSLYKYTPANESWEKISLTGNNNIKSLYKGECWTYARRNRRWPV